MMNNMSSECYPPRPPKKSPWLVYTHGRFKDNQTFYSIEEDCCYEKSIPDMNDKLTYPCCHGWIFTLDMDMDSDDCFLFNPVSLANIELPQWGPFRLRSCTLSLPPDDPNCVVVAYASTFDGQDPYIRHCRPGDHEWNDQNLVDNGRILHFPTACNGKIYGRASVTTLMVLDINGSTIDARPVGVDLPSMSIPETVSFSIYLIESYKELFAVRALKLGETSKFRDMEVFKLDTQNLQWLKVESLGDRAFFIDIRANCTTSCSTAESGIKGNAIYFIVGQNYKNLYVFDLEDKSTMVCLPRQKRFKKCLDAFWIMPSV